MTFDLIKFRLMFPMFDTVSDAVVMANSEQALCMIAPGDCGCGQAEWQLMTAHLLQLIKNTTAGSNSGVLSSATIDKVSVAFQAPPYGSSAYKFWLFSTPFGSQLAAMLARCSAGGVYVGGAPERSAFRRVGGRFPRGGRL